MTKLTEFYKDKKVLVTGHTGFKGSWMCMVLKHLGSEIIGYGLEAPTDPSMFTLCNLATGMTSVTGDIRDLNALQMLFKETLPDIVIHMAAQPIVRESYKNPVYTYDVNVMGTVNVLECIRNHTSVKSFINVTTDKVYYNDERQDGYRETDIINGYDPYSNSKSCSELVTSAYKKSFFADNDEKTCAISTCRAGNVIGGGDFAVDRIIPDCVRAVLNKKSIIVRNPFSIRPYQHVLEPVIAYLYVAMMQYNDITLSGSYNIGPNDSDCYTTGNLVSLFCNKWNQFETDDNLSWINEYDGGPHEAAFLKLDNTLIAQKLGWKPRWNVEYSIDKIIEWTKTYSDNGSIIPCTNMQIEEYLNDFEGVL